MLSVLTLPNDDPRKTIAVALLLCLVCSLVVSTAAVSLRPLQEHNAAISVKREILRAAGLYQAGINVQAEYDAKIEERLVDLDSGRYVTDRDPLSYDQRRAAAEPEASKALSADEDIARIRRRANIAKVYLLEQDGQLQRIILPVHGYGLWSTMYGLLALAPDGRTVEAVSFYDQRETAGLGGEVANPDWQAGWVGKLVTDTEGKPALHLIKGTVDPASPQAKYQVDGLAGATLTSNGVTNLLKFWMGEKGFGPYLARLTGQSQGT